MRGKDVSIFAIGKRATSFFAGYHQLFDTRCEILCLQCNGDGIPAHNLETVVIDLAKIRNSTKKTVPPFPDWEWLDKGAVEADDYISSRFRARLSILADENRKKVQKGLKTILGQNVGYLFVILDFTDPFSSGILWDCVHMARKAGSGGELKIMGFLGIGGEDKMDGSSQAQLYAALKEINHILQHGESLLPYALPGIDKVFFLDRESLSSKEDGRPFANFLLDTCNGEFLTRWLTDIQKKEESGLFSKKYSPARSTGNKGDIGQSHRVLQCEFSALFPYEIDPSPLTDACTLRFSREIVVLLLEYDSEELPGPMHILRDVFIAKDDLVKWAAELVDELSHMGDTQVPISLDEFVTLCTIRQHKLISRFVNRFESLWARNDLPGELGKRVQNLLDHYSIVGVISLLQKIEELLSAWCSDMGIMLYKSREGNCSFDSFISELVAERKEGEAMLSDHRGRRFLPSYTIGLEHGEIQRLLLRQIADKQRAFLRGRLEFSACSQCLTYLTCALQDIRQYINETMEVRHNILEKVAASLESKLEEARGSLENQGIDARTFHEIYKKWFDSLGGERYLEETVRAIRRNGLPLKSSGIIRIKQIEKVYPGELENALVSFVKSNVTEKTKRNISPITQVWITKRLVPKARADQDAILTIPDSATFVKESIFLCIPKLDCKKEDFKEVPLLNGTIQKMPVRSCHVPSLYRCVYGLPVSFLRGVETWFSAYEKAITEQRPIHVIKSVVYANEPSPSEPFPIIGPPELIFQVALRGNILEEKKGKVGYEGRKACFWGVFWNRKKGQPIWMSHDEFLKKLEVNPSLQEELSGLITSSVLALALEKKLNAGQATKKWFEGISVKDSIKGLARMMKQVEREVDNLLRGMQ